MDSTVDRSRRRFTAGLAAAGAAVAVGVTPRIAEARTRRREGIVGVDISAHPVPFPDTIADVCRYDQGWLDAQARRYWLEFAQHLGRPLDEYDRADFWFRYIAIPLQEKAVLGRSLGTGTDGIERDLGLMHMVGFYGGIWFFKKIAEFQGNDPTASCASPTPESPPEAFAPLGALLRELLAVARNGTDDQALDRAERAVWDVDLVGQVADTSDLATRRGMIGGYSYNVGYCNAVLVPDNRPLPPPLNPAGPSPFNPPWNSFTFTPSGVFDATYPVWADPATQGTVTPQPPGNPSPLPAIPYLIGDAAALRIARPAFVAAKAAHPDAYQRLEQGMIDRNGAVVARGDLRALAQLGFNTGTATWTALPMLDVRRWDDRSFQLLNALDLFFLQAVQVAGMVDMAATMNDDALAARHALLATALVVPFGASYLIGSDNTTNPAYACRTSDESVPPFVFGRV